MMAYRFTLACLFSLATLGTCALESTASPIELSTIEYNDGVVRVVPIHFEKVETMNEAAESLLSNFFDDFGPPSFLHDDVDRSFDRMSQDMAKIESTFSKMLHGFRINQPRLKFSVRFPSKENLKQRYTCPCTVPAKELCPPQEPGFLGRFKTSLCLADHESIIPEGCRSVMANTVTLECRDDINSLCGNVTPGNKNVHKCLLANKDKLSPRCTGYFSKKPALEARPAEISSVSASSTTPNGTATVTASPAELNVVELPPRVHKATDIEHGVDAKEALPVAASKAAVLSEAVKKSNFTVVYVVIIALAAVVVATIAIVYRRSNRADEDTPYNAMLL